MKIILDMIDFDFFEWQELVYNFDEKVDFLYEIDFLRFEASTELVNKLKLLHSDIFWFKKEQRLTLDIGWGY